MSPEESGRNRVPSLHSIPNVGTPTWLVQVTALAAHELGNSVTALTFAMELFRDRQRAPEDVLEVDEMRAVLGQASTLVRLLARLASPPTPVVRLDLRAVVADAAPLLERLASRRLRVALPDDEIPLVAARSEIERALVELVLAAHDCGDVSRSADLAVARDPLGAHIHVEVAGAVHAPAADALPYTNALAAACHGSAAIRPLANGALRIEVALANPIP